MKRQPFTFLLLLCIFAQGAVFAGSEFVYVFKVTDENAIVVRRNGDAHMIEYGVGCLSLWRYEGKAVLIYSPGLFLGVGSELLIPEENQKCRIWDSDYLGSFDDLSSSTDDSDCDDEHWIASKSDDGAVIVLEDGSVWQVDDVDRVDSALWLITENIIVCNGFMLNLDNSERVSVTRLK